MKKNLIIIFTRNPELGKCKTRLAKTIGDVSALNIYKYLLQHTENTVREIDCDKAVYYSVKIRDNDIWNASIYQKHKQQGEDLGERMLNAFKNAFNNGYKKVVIVGSDLFHLKQHHIQHAFKALKDNPVVIGPALDGGYYLLGMNTLHASVFKNKAWGTNTVFNDTIENLKAINVHLLEPLNDVDVYNDIKDISELKALITND